MKPTLPFCDITRLRALAANQKRISELSVMEKRRKIWTGINAADKNEGQVHRKK